MVLFVLGRDGKKVLGKCGDVMEFAILALQLAFSSVFLALLTATIFDFSRLRHASRFSRSPLGGFQQIQAHNPSIPVVQECLDIITEHQKLLALVKGELAKGLLPQSSVRAYYTVQRTRELAAGTCVKNFEYISDRDKLNKKWSELPTDSHLLLSTSTKRTVPEKYLAVVSGVPSVLHPGASLLAVSKQSPPNFALYWDKKPQFSFDGRTALWDSVLLLCHKIKTDYCGIMRGLHSGNSA
nr:transmembrane protein 209 [Tanacetum cinerariifolium]